MVTGMKRTQWIELTRKIAGSKASFFAIILFIAFGVGLFTGIGWTAYGIDDSILKVFEDCNFHDLEIFAPYGFDEDDLKTLAEQEDTEDVEGYYSWYASFESGEEKLQAKLLSVTERIDLFYHLVGSVPEQPGEILVQKHWAEEYGYSVGDRIRLLREVETENYLTTDDFVITGMADVPAYTNLEAAGFETSPATSTEYDCILFVDESSFEQDTFLGYTNALVRLRSLRSYNGNSEEYSEKSEQAADAFLAAANEITEQRYDELRTLAALTGSDAPPKEGCVVFTREGNVSRSFLLRISDMFRDFKYNLALVFMVIGILVCYSSVTRLVFKDVRLLGVKKALGFSRREIASLYQIYAVLCSAIGSVFGVLLGRFVLEPIFLNVLGSSYAFGEKVYYFSLSESLLLLALETAAMLTATLVASRKTLRRKPVSLLAGPEPPSGRAAWYEKTKLWTGLPILSKCIVNNFRNDKRRVMATLIGIIGCTTMIVTALSLGRACVDSFDIQFERLQKFNAIVFFDPQNDGSQDAISQTLEEKGCLYCPVYSTRIVMNPPAGKSLCTMLFVGELGFRGLTDQTDISGTGASSGDGIWIPCAYAEEYGLSIGDTVDFTDESSELHTVRVAGVFEYYLQNSRVLMTPEFYEKEYGKPFRYNAVLTETDVPEMTAKLSQISGMIGIKDYYADAADYQSSITMIFSAVTYIYFLMAVMISFFVLLDLLVMFVEERKRELITLMINGYSVKYARKYIYTDTIWLSVIGIVIGTVCGVLLNYLILNTVSSDFTYFIRRIDIPACLIGMAASAVMSTLMTLLALRKIGKFRLSDINE